jgi:hypothetical protein
VTIGVALLMVATLSAGGDSPPPVNVHLWAAKATVEKRDKIQIDRELEPIRPAVAGLPYDTYRKVAVSWRAIAYGEEGRLPINAEYTLIAKPLSADPDGRIRIAITVEMAKPDRPPVNALQTTMSLVPGKLVTLRGLMLNDGDLLIVLKAEK